MKSYSVVVLSIGKVYAAQAGELLKILLFIRDQGIYMAYICCTVLGQKKKKKCIQREHQTFFFVCFNTNALQLYKLMGDSRKFFPFLV